VTSTDASQALATITPAENLQGILEDIDAGVSDYVAAHGRTPKDLQELVRGKFLRKIPEAPTGKKWIVDPSTGRSCLVAK
jgi:hypothetical protein